MVISILLRQSRLKAMDESKSLLKLASTASYTPGEKENNLSDLKYQIQRQLHALCHGVAFTNTATGSGGRQPPF